MEEQDNINMDTFVANNFSSSTAPFTYTFDWILLLFIYFEAKDYYY